MSDLSVHNLTLEYGSGASANLILKGVSLELQRGEVIALLGSSGSGKTTLLRAVAGLESPKDGRIQLGQQTLFDGSKGLELPAEHRNLGLVFQSYALWPHKTVAENVAYGLQLRKVAKAEIQQRVEQILGHLGLAHLAARFPHQLSGGQQQRVAIARALVYNPPVILLDEPLSNLDAKLREEARAFLRELIIEMKLSALMVTHDQAEAMAISDRILLLNNGVIEQQGTPQSMYETPQTLFTAEFMGSNNKFKAELQSQNAAYATVSIFGQSLQASVRGKQVGANAHAVIRLEKVKVLHEAGANAIRLALSTCMYLGDRWECLFGHGEQLIRAYSPYKLAAGEYWLQFAADDLWLY